jgi:glycosyltransferase involved in cell wall biosynthesis
MKKICLIIHSLGVGGMERVMHQLILNFSKRDDINLDLVLIGKKREVVYSLPSDVNVHRPSFEFDDSKRFFDTLRTIRFLRRKVKDIDPDRILSFGEYWNNLVLLSLYGLPYPVFISDRSKPGKDLGTLQNFLRDTLYSKAAGYIAQTEEAKEVCLSSRWNENICVIGNPIRKIQSNGREKKENIVLSVGRLIKTKHFDQLIRMFLEIGKPDWKLMIVGGDAKKQHLTKELNTLIDELDARDSVFLEGEQQDIDSYYQKSKIFAFTSSSEGFPNVIGEALSAGLPVISYDCVAGPSDMIEDGKNGFLVPLHNTSKFKEKLSLLMGNEDLRTQMSKIAKNSINNFSTASIAEEYYEFMNSQN